MKRLVVVAVLFAGCGRSPYIDGFHPTPEPAGYTRFVTPVLHDIQPGSGDLYCQWLQAPLDHDVDVVAVAGQQSKWGHHVVLYANSANEPVGTSRVCLGSDMLSIRYVGAIGGEGSSLITLPPNVVMRIPAGQSLMANVHFLNGSSAPIDGQAVLDIQFAEPSASDQVAGFFTDLNTTFKVPAQQAAAADSTCVVQKDMNFFAFADHMHELGRSIYSEVVHLDGTKTSLAKDNPWAPEWTFNPPFSLWPTSNLLDIHRGETIHTHCEWDNTTTSAAVFPGEMCVGLGFFLPGGTNDVICADGQWAD